MKYLGIDYGSKKVDIFEAKHSSYFASIGVLFLMFVLWVSLLTKFTFLWLFFVIILSVVFVWVANVFFEGFNLRISNENGVCTLTIYSGVLRWKRINNYEFTISDLK